MSEETNETSQANVTLNDFLLMVKVIDICSKRGAFEGAELKDVGTLRDRLAAFIEANRPPEEETSEEEAGTPEEEAK
jgi:hypothetical protein